MDDRLNSQSQDTATQKSTGCCGGKSDTQPQTKAAAPIVQAAKDTPAISGCRCGQN